MLSQVESFLWLSNIHYAYIPVCMYIHVCVHICMCMSVCICVCVYIYMECFPYPFAYWWTLVSLIASLTSELVKNLPAMQEIPVHFLGWEDSLGEGIGYPLQYSWASLVAQLVKNPSVMCETWVQSLGRAPGEGKGCPLQYSSLESQTVPESQTWLSNFFFLF